MPLYEETLDSLIEQVCRVMLRDWKSGTATGGSTTTFIDTSRLEKDDYYNSLSPAARVHIRTTTDSAAPMGEEREISDWVQSTHTGTVDPAFSAAIGAGDTYAILQQYGWDEIREAINTAIKRVQKIALIEKIDEETLTVDDVNEYPIPDGFVYIYRITQSTNDGDFYVSPVPPDQYKIIRGASTPRIHFYNFPEDAKHSDHYYSNLWINTDFAASRKLRIEGYGKQEKLVNDTDLCYINPNYVCAQAAAFLHSSRIEKPSDEYDWHRVQAEIWQEQADREFTTLQTPLPPDTKRVVI